MSEANGHREHLEQRAEEVRSKLERRLKLIDERRHRVADVARSATLPASMVLLAAAGLAAVFLIQRVRRRRSRMERFLRLLESPPPVERSPFVKNMQKAATSLALVAVKRLGQRGLDHWLAEPAHAEPQPTRYSRV